MRRTRRAVRTTAARLGVALVIVASGCGEQSEQPGGAGAPPIQAGPLPRAALVLSPAITVATDATSVYWTTNDRANLEAGTVMKCTAADCEGTVVTLASHQYIPYEVVVDEARVYWATAGTAAALLSCPIEGGTATTIASGGQGPLAVDAQNVYWAGSDPESLFSCSKDGCQAGPILLWKGKSTSGVVRSLSADGTDVYWVSSDGNLLECPATGCNGAPVTLASAGAVSGLAVDANDIYWTTFWAGTPSGVARCAKHDCAGTATAIASGPYSWSKIVSDESSLYWTDMSGSVVTCPKPGCAGGPVTLASGGAPLSGSVAVAVNASTVYWTALAGLMSAPK